MKKRVKSRGSIDKAAQGGTSGNSTQSAPPRKVLSLETGRSTFTSPEFSPGILNKKNPDSQTFAENRPTSKSSPSCAEGEIASADYKSKAFQSPVPAPLRPASGHRATNRHHKSIWRIFALYYRNSLVYKGIWPCKVVSLLTDMFSSRPRDSRYLRRSEFGDCVTD